MSHKELTAQIRAALKAAGIKARISLYTSCGICCVRISVPEFSVKFTEDQQTVIKNIARSYGLTGANGSPINPLPVNPDTFHFEVP